MIILFRTIMWNINAAGMFGFEDILWNVSHKPSHTNTLRVTTLIPITFSEKLFRFSSFAMKNQHLGPRSEFNHLLNIKPKLFFNQTCEEKSEWGKYSPARFIGITQILHHQLSMAHIEYPLIDFELFLVTFYFAMEKFPFENVLFICNNNNCEKNRRKQPTNKKTTSTGDDNMENLSGR